MRGDARLAEARDFLKFVDGQFVLLQQRDDAQPRGSDRARRDFRVEDMFFSRAKFFQESI